MLGFILRLRSVRPDGAKSVPVSKIPTPNSLAAKKAHPYCSYRKPNAPILPRLPLFPNLAYFLSSTRERPEVLLTC